MSNVVCQCLVFVGSPSAISDAMAVSTIAEAMEITEAAVWISGAIVLMS